MKTNKPILVTGVAGFIGFHIAQRLLKDGFSVCGLDNLNEYYDVNLKKARLQQLKSQEHFHFFQLDISNAENLVALWERENFETIIHLAAQAGVRYSVTHPHIYLRNNVDGFLNILECCRKIPNAYLVYASSSSVYGTNTKLPFSEQDCTESPKSLYGATKKMNELMAHAYAKLHGIKSVGLRYFTVYGPWGRPDMALFLFSDAIRNNRPIEIFNGGNMKRAFTFIDDVVEATVRIAKKGPLAEYKIYNIGSHQSVPLMDAINILENCLEKKVIKQFKELQPGDILQTYADTSDLVKDFDYKPATPLKEGVQRFVNWYLEYYKDE